MDQKEIVGVLKEEGLDIAEDLAVQAVRGAFRLLKAMLPKVNPVLPMVINPLLEQLEPMLLGIVDQIDGKDDPGY